MMEETKLSRREKRREREKELRYNTILNAAEELFAKKGFLKTNVDEIADLSEVSVGTVYFYFKNKEELLVHLFEKSLFLLRTILGKEFKNALSPVHGMEMAGYAFFEKFCIKYPEKALILFRESPAQGKKMEDQRKKMSDVLTRDLRKALEQLSLEENFQFRNNSSTDVFAMCILGIYERVASHFLIQSKTNTTTLREISTDAVDFIIGGIKDITKKYGDL